MKIHAFENSHRAAKALIAAKYNKVDLEFVNVKMGVENKTESFLKMNPMGKIPVLETEEGAIFESNAIARYVARIRRDTNLCGKTFFEAGVVDSWIDFAANELDIAGCMWIFPLLGYMPYNAAVEEKSKADFTKAMTILNEHLTLKTFVVGERITLADIVLVCGMMLPLQMVCEKSFRKPFTHVMRWFNTCINQPEFKAVLGDIKLCDKALKPAKTEEAPKKKEEKKPAAKPAAKKKEAHPLDCLPKSPLVLDNWKRCYSNSRADYYASMEEFWKMYDAEGYSLWICDYNYNSDNQVGFMTSNLLDGFLQRSDAMRKYAFGGMTIQCKEEKAPFCIQGAWLFRGDTEKHMIESNPDAEYYTWTRITELTEENKKKIADLWCAGEKIGDMEVFDSKNFR
eukprot:TRINITY_DN775994_c0_g1_i1.p1 TRINITY_DN775994_c0_g1~~TRINITY_DN775994_c0_g1_i1.p1  ORF type:complete len:406 (+),score=60.44 TRINITY_DN775994_c0_g1_i1:25-1218(+)